MKNSTERTVYKVTRPDGTSISGHLFPELSVTYKAGEFVRPKLRTSKLFAFESLERAMEFAGNNNGRGVIIWEATARRVEPLERRATWSITPAEIRRFWRNPTSVMDGAAPRGTVGCGSIRVNRVLSFSEPK